jgi:hypothetical protein
VPARDPGPHAEGGRQRVCLTEIDGFPAPNVIMHSRGRMTFALRDGTIRTRVRVTQRFRGDSRHARQSTTGTILGAGRYRTRAEPSPGRERSSTPRPG